MYSLIVATRGILRLLVFSLPLVSPGVVAQAVVETPRTIHVVMDNAYAPYSFQSEEGKLQGIAIDQWQAWERKTGIKVEIHAMDWGEALRRMRAGEFDVIDDIVETPERRDYLDFTPPYATIGASIFFRSNISGITDLASLRGFSVGAKAEGYLIDDLKANGVTTVLPFPNYEAIVAAAKQQKVNVFVADAPPTIYLLNKLGIEDEFRLSAPVSVREMRRAVRKGNADLLRTVLEGFASIEPGELKRIDEKWIGRTISKYGRYLTYAGYAAALVILLVAGLSGWNRALRRGILQRTTALGESEQRYRRLVELMPVAVYVCDASGVIQSYNNRAVELWGCEPKLGDTAQRYCGSLRLYSPDGELVPHEDSKMAEVLRTGVQARDVEVVMERPDGSSITVLVNIEPLRNAAGELMGAMNCFQDITGRKQAENAIRDSGAQLMALSRRLVELRESERKELARELHDRVGQSLTALKINIDMLQPVLASQGDDEALARVADSAALLESTMDTIENVTSELRPPMLDHHGLVAALDWHARNFSRRTKIAIAMRCSDPDMRPAPEVEIALFRIAQEALNNIAKHAEARHAEIALDQANGECVMSVRDDGIGFDGADEASNRFKPGLGIISMRERSQAVGGRLEVRGLPGGGTQLTVRVQC